MNGGGSASARGARGSANRALKRSLEQQIERQRREQAVEQRGQANENDRRIQTAAE